MLTARGEVSAPVLPASLSSLSSLLQFRAQLMKHLPHSGSFYLKPQPGCDSGYPDLDNSALRRLFLAVSLSCAKLSVKTKQVGLLGTDTQEHPLTTGIEGCVGQHPYLVAGPTVTPPPPEPLCSLTGPVWFRPYHLHASCTVYHVNCWPPGVCGGSF